MIQLTAAKTCELEGKTAFLWDEPTLTHSVSAQYLCSRFCGIELPLVVYTALWTISHEKPSNENNEKKQAFRSM